jgi:ribosome-binding factor A
MASRKLERAASLIKQAVSRVVLYEMNDPRMQATVTVTRVKVTPELRSAEVYVSLMGSEAQIAATYRALQHAAGHVTSLVGSRLSFRNTPVLRFILDDSLKRGFCVTQLINQAMEEVRQKEAAATDAAQPAEGDSAETDPAAGQDAQAAETPRDRP